LKSGDLPDRSDGRAIRLAYFHFAVLTNCSLKPLAVCAPRIQKAVTNRSFTMKQQHKYIDLPIDEIKPDPKQPRKDFSEDELEELGRSLGRHGQLVPIVVFEYQGKSILVDGERRWRAAQRVGLQTLRACVWDHVPSLEELSVSQVVINSARQQLSPLELLAAYEELMRSKKLTASELAELLNVSKAKITRILSLKKCSPEELKLVSEGTLSSVNAYALTRMDETERKGAVTEFVKDKSVPNTNGRKRRNCSTPIKAKARVVFELPQLVTTLVSKDKLTFESVVDAFQTLIKECKKAKGNGWDISTLAQTLRDGARAQSREAGNV
jgi:ParB/RepB/Spo0J family partition protein